MDERARQNGRHPSAISRIVKPLLAALSMDRKQLAQEIRVTYATLYAWSVDRRRPSPKNAERLAEVAEQRARELDRLADRLRGIMAERENGAVARGTSNP